MTSLKQKHLRLLTFFFMMIILKLTAYSQKSTNTSDSITVPKDSISIQQTKKKSKITDEIRYNATDSIVFNRNGNAYLYGNGNIKQKDIELTANRIHMNLDSSQVNASGTVNEDGEAIGTPIFSEKGTEYKAKELTYNFDTKKGFIRHGVIQQGEGYIISEKTKKGPDDELFIKDGKYTTCDLHDHPHFYLNLTRAKVKQKKWVVTGPAYMVLLDIPMPIAIPFGYFPFTDDYSSGVIIPEYGDELSRGFYLTNGGYYFAFSDYFDLALTGEIYTKGTWGLAAISTYTKRYKFRGNFNLNYREDVVGFKEIPSEYSKAKNFGLVWSHSQDSKANPYRTLSASVNFSSSGYDRSNINSYYNPNVLSQNTKSSSVSYSYRFPDSPFSLSANILANQRTSDSTVSLTLPNINLSMSRIYPFKKKSGISKNAWYEKIYFSYNANVSNSITAKEDLLWNASLSKDWQNGMSHAIPLGASFNLFKYLAITPTANYNERWYTKSIKRNWDTATDTLKTDTIQGFARAYDFNVGISASTKLYGFYTPLRSLFGNKVDRIRHVFTPSIGFNYKPDFADPKWNMYSSYMAPADMQYTFEPTLKTYSRFEGGMFGYPAAGKSGNISYSINNNLEMKVKQRNDSTDVPTYKTVSLVDGFGVNGSYNLAADSMNWSNLNANIRLKLHQKYTLNLSAIYEMYMYELNAAGNPNRVNKLRWDEGKMPRLVSTGTSFSYAISDQTFSKKDTKAAGKSSTTPTDSIKKERVGEYTKFSMPWSLSFNYSVNYSTTGIFNKEIMEYDRELVHNISINGNLNLTAKWNLSGSAAYDINNKIITYSNLAISRNLHCWSMSANIVPFGLYKSYNFTIHANSDLLQDLKYEKRNEGFNANNWY